MADETPMDFIGMNGGWPSDDNYMRDPSRAFGHRSQLLDEPAGGPATNAVRCQKSLCAAVRTDLNSNTHGIWLSTFT